MSAASTTPRRVLIDTDPGVDDALALLLALASPELHVEAITTVAGNVGLEQATRNALLTLDVARVEDPPPVARGARKPLEREATDAAYVHGEDGLGGMAGAYGPPSREALEGSATDCILETIARHPGETTVVALGPLTNIARAVLADPRTMALAERIVVMGGALDVAGNAGPCAEFNFFVDPEAAQIVLRSALPVTLVGLDVTRQAVVSRQEIVERTRLSGKPAAVFAERITRQYFDVRLRQVGRAECFLHDPLAVAVALDPSLVRGERLWLDVETRGALTTGMVVADRRDGAPRPGPGDGVEVALALDSERFRGLFFDRLFRA